MFQKVPIFVLQYSNKVNKSIQMNNMDKLNKKLTAMFPKTSPAQRMEAAVKLNCHLETVERYMRGKAKKEWFAIELINILSQSSKQAA